MFLPLSENIILPPFFFCLGLQTVEHMGTCGVCNKTSIRTYNLKVHHCVHSGECPYPCDVCNKTYRCTCSLKVHQRVRTGERPYHCDVCNKTFRVMEHLKVHKLVHTGEHPYGIDREHKSCDMVIVKLPYMSLSFSVLHLLKVVIQFPFFFLF